MLNEIITSSSRTIVYRGLQGVTGRPIIVKKFQPWAGNSLDVIRLKQEYLLHEALSKEFTWAARPISFESAEGSYKLVLEDAGGDSLDRVIQSDKLPLGTKLKLSLMICDLLSELHEVNIVHRDFRPSNLLWNRQQNHIQLIDLSLAAKITGKEPPFSSEDQPQGSFPYRSPEQTGRLNRRIDHRSDYYSFGVFLYEWLTGMPTYREQGLAEQIHCVLTKEPDSPFNVTGGAISPFLSDVIMKLLAKDPEDRYQSALGIKADLIQAYEGRTYGKPGQAELRGQFRISQRLFGRQEELDLLQAALRSSAVGSPMFGLIHGTAGCGKTALINELKSAVYSWPGGYFLEGKFDSNHRDLPYLAIANAFRGWFVRMMGGSGNLQLKEAAPALLESLQGSGALITALIPELEQLIGVQPAVEPLNPTEESNRFYSIFVRFITALTADGPPVVLFLDDLQWADSPSLLLLEKLASAEQSSRLLVLLAYREEQLESSFAAGLARLSATPRTFDIRLEPLEQIDVAALIGDSLPMSAAERERLAAALIVSTQGNAFFVHQLLAELNRSGGLYFDPLLNKWRWIEESLDEFAESGDVEHFLAGKLHRLTSRVSDVLSLASIIGREFDYELLLQTGRWSGKELLEALEIALEEELISACETTRELMQYGAELLEGDAESMQLLSKLLYRFRHDRLQTAFYERLSEDEADINHLRLAQQLMTRLDNEPFEDSLVSLAIHLNYGLYALADANERMNAILLVVRAAHKAKQAHGYDTAFLLLDRIRPLLPASGLTQTAWLRPLVNRLYAECGYLTWRVQEAEDACRELLCEAASPYAAAEIRAMQASYYMYLGMLPESMEAGRVGLQLLGVSLPDKPTKLHVMRDLIKTKLKLRGKTTDELLSGPIMRDATVLLKMRLLINMFPSAFISGQAELFGLLALKKVGLTLQHGVATESSFAFIGYSMLLSGIGNKEQAYTYGQLGVRINEKFNDVQWRGPVLTLYSLFSHGWKQPWDTLQDWFQRAMFSSQQAGDPMYQSHAAYYRNLWHPSMTLPELIRDIEASISQIRQNQYKASLDTAELARQYYLNLAGKLPDPNSFDGVGFREADYLERLRASQYRSGIAIYHIYRMKLLYHRGELELAQGAVMDVQAVIGSLAGSLFMEEYVLFSYLILSDRYEGLGVGGKLQARRLMRRGKRMVVDWAKANPAVFSQHLWLMKAADAERGWGGSRSGERRGSERGGSGHERERSGSERRGSERGRRGSERRSGERRAARCYDLALSAAKASGFIRYEALAHERAGEYYKRAGSEEYGAYLLKQASDCYALWGAESKVEGLGMKRDLG
ncbi:ATP-binding protein [Paenibacillus herberti]|uniref:ATP-binding protein n=1 Tax=Paenibacillus herberti TaxID=1619309 RepID=UPI001595B6BA|nr:serine/threonine-protein kinase [Paenibacillus herberti]